VRADLVPARFHSLDFFFLARASRLAAYTSGPIAREVASTPNKSNSRSDICFPGSQDKVAKGENGWNPDANEQPLHPINKKPQINGQHEREKR
jgi:hypothetical protein